MPPVPPDAAERSDECSRCRCHKCVLREECFHVEVFQATCDESRGCDAGSGAGRAVAIAGVLRRRELFCHYRVTTAGALAGIADHQLYLQLYADDPAEREQRPHR